MKWERVSLVRRVRAGRQYSSKRDLATQQNNFVATNTAITQLLAYNEHVFARPVPPKATCPLAPTGCRVELSEQMYMYVFVCESAACRRDDTKLNVDFFTLSWHTHRSARTWPRQSIASRKTPCAAKPRNRHAEPMITNRICRCRMSALKLSNYEQWAITQLKLLAASRSRASSRSCKNSLNFSQASAADARRPLTVEHVFCLTFKVFLSAQCLNGWHQHEPIQCRAWHWQVTNKDRRPQRLRY